MKFPLSKDALCQFYLKMRRRFWIWLIALCFTHYQRYPIHVSAVLGRKLFISPKFTNIFTICLPLFLGKWHSLSFEDTWNKIFCVLFGFIWPSGSWKDFKRRQGIFIHSVSSPLEKCVASQSIPCQLHIWIWHWPETLHV